MKNKGFFIAEPEALDERVLMGVVSGKKAQNSFLCTRTYEETLKGRWVKGSGYVGILFGKRDLATVTDSVVSLAACLAERTSPPFPQPTLATQLSVDPKYRAEIQW